MLGDYIGSENYARENEISINRNACNCANLIKYLETLRVTSRIDYSH